MARKAKKSEPKPVPDARRMTAEMVGWVYGISGKAVGLWHSRDGCPRNQDRTYDLQVVTKWRESRRAEADDALMDGAPKDSPAAERYRLAKAMLEELKLDERRGQLVEVDWMWQRLQGLASLLRDLNKAMRRRKGGVLFAEMLNETLDQFDRDTERLFADAKRTSHGTAS